MGLFGFGKKKISDQILKYFKDKGITLEQNEGKYSFELNLKDAGCTLYPYFTVDEEKKELSYCVNIRKTEGGITLTEYAKFNEFNRNSKYLQAKISEDDTLYLEYNTGIDEDNVKAVIERITENVFMHAKEIDEL